MCVTMPCRIHSIKKRESPTFKTCAPIIKITGAPRRRAATIRAAIVGKSTFSNGGISASSGKISPSGLTTNRLRSNSGYAITPSHCLPDSCLLFTHPSSPCHLVTPSPCHLSIPKQIAPNLLHHAKIRNKYIRAHCAEPRLLFLVHHASLFIEPNGDGERASLFSDA